MIKKIGLLFLIIFAFSSCVSRKKMAYFQNISEVSSDRLYETKLQPDDLLQISVNAPSPNPELADPFNLTVINSDATTATAGRSYQIDRNGEIIMPLIGTIKLAGLTHAEALDKIKEEVGKYIVNPIVDFRITNFKVSVIGAVVSPGSFPVNGERITLPEALALAGDLKMTGVRTNILVIREIEGKKTYSYVDITQADFINSEYYYLAQNDLVVVEPNKAAMNSSAIGTEVTIAISALTLLISIITFATR